jgi:uncharacterized protein (DUF2252 family)
MLGATMKAASLIQLIALPELRLLHAVVPAAAARKAKRMVKSPNDFVRGSLPLLGPWLATEMTAGEPWVWAIGDGHQGNFASLAVGKMNRDGIVPVTFGIADVDDEGPAPWPWDLLRLLSSVRIAAPEMKRSAFAELCGVTLSSYRECMHRFSDDDAMAARIDANSLPEAVKTLIAAGTGEAKAKRFIASMAAGRGTSLKLRRDAEVADDPDAAACLRASWERRQGLPAHAVLDLAQRLKPGGLSSLGRRRWWLLIRESVPMARVRLLEIKERAPSALARVLPVSPFTPWMRDGVAQPVCSTMGNDPYQRVLHAAAGEYLVRTRCHTRATLDLATLDPSDRRRLGHLYGQLIATYHWQGLSQLTPDPAEHCAAVATATKAWDERLVKQADQLADHLVDLAAAYRLAVKPLLGTRTRRGDETLELG